MILRAAHLLTWLCIGAGGSLIAQDNHYWTQQHGARASLMGGATVANADDQAVLFYNPAAVRRVKGTGITTSANYFYMQWLKAEDLSGLGIEISDDNVDVAPRMLVGSFDPKGEEGVRVSIGYVSNLYGQFNVQETGQHAKDVDPETPGIETASSLFNSYTTTREDLLGLGFSKILGAHSSVGLTLFGSAFSQHYLRTTDVGLYGDPTVYDTVPVLLGNLVTERGDISNLGLQAKLGYFHSGEHHNWGLAVTFPRLSTYLWQGSMYRATTYIGPDTQDKHLYSSEELDTRYRTPWIVDLGYELRKGTSVWAFRLGFASALAGYDRMTLTTADMDQLVQPPSETTIRRVRSGNVPVLNLGVGAEFPVSPIADLLAGFRTDHNFLDRSVLDASTDITGTFSYWDLYHTSFGVDLHSERVKLTIGAVFSFGQTTGQPEAFEELSELIIPTTELQLRTSYYQLGMTFGFSYFVLGSRADKRSPSDAP